MRKFIAITFIAIISLTGCADTHQIVRLGSNDFTKLNSNDGIYIAVPKDGSYGDKYYNGSGINTTQMIYSAFSMMARDIEQGREYEKFSEAIESAKSNGSKYLIYPTILHWEDRATEWSGIPDKVEVKIEVVDIKTKKSITGSIVKGTSGVATFGGDHPQDLLREPISKYITSLY